MNTFVKWGLLALATTFGSGLAAQENGAQPTTEFPLGTEQEVQVGQTYFVNKSGDWEVRCVKLEEGNDPCHMYQLLKDETDNSVAEISLFHLPAGGAAIAGASAITPLGTLLTANLLLAIDDKPAKAYPFNWCEAVGCVARLGFTGIELQAMKKGKEATLTIRSIAAPGEPVNVAVSLMGFSNAYEAIAPKQ